MYLAVNKGKKKCNFQYKLHILGTWKIIVIIIIENKQNIFF